MVHRRELDRDELPLSTSRRLADGGVPCCTSWPKGYRRATFSTLATLRSRSRRATAPSSSDRDRNAIPTSNGVRHLRLDRACSGQQFAAEQRLPEVQPTVAEDALCE